MIDMTQPDNVPEAPDDALVRSESWAGEVRINLIRLGALVFFYAHHLSSVYIFKDDGMTAQGRAAVTILVLLWALAAVGLHLILARRWLPAWLPDLSIVLDLVMIGLLLPWVGGPKSTLVLLLFLVIASTPPRMSLGAVYLATLGSLAVYLAVLAWYVYAQVGAAVYYADPAQRIPRSSQMIFVLALLTAGFLAGRLSSGAAAGPDHFFHPGTGEVTMADVTVCPHCTAPVQPGWKACPMCARTLGGRPSVEIQAGGPSGVRRKHRWDEPIPVAAPDVEKDVKSDTTMIGSILLVLGILGILGIFLYVQGGQGRSPEGVWAVGIATVVVISVGSIS